MSEVCRSSSLMPPGNPMAKWIQPETSCSPARQPIGYRTQSRPSPNRNALELANFVVQERFEDARVEFAS